VGSAVEARWRGGHHWFQGWIVRYNANGTAVIRYNDGQLEDVPVTSLRGSTAVSYTAPASALSSLPVTLAADMVSTLPTCHLKCTYAEGVAMGALPEVHRSIVAAAESELVVGRLVQPPAFWDQLVPEKEVQTRVSRKHFKIFCRKLPLPDGGSNPVLFLRCLSPNGLVFNGRYLGADAGEQRIHHGDSIALAVSVSTPDAVEAVKSTTSVATAAAWRPPALKPFLIFELQVSELPETTSEPQTKAVVLEQATPVALPLLGHSRAAEPSTGTAASLYPASPADSTPIECFALQKDGQLCESPLVKFFRTQLGS